MKISMVVAMARNGVIGRNGTLPWRMPADLKHFKELTLGKPVVMGRKTWESIGKPLPGRRNIVISRNPGYQAPGATVVANLRAALDEAAREQAPEVMIMGGSSIYAEALPLADCLHVTRIDGEVDGDTFFPPLDESAWVEVAREAFPADDRHPWPFQFLRFVRQGRG